MESLPDELLARIFSQIRRTADRGSLSLVCRRFYEVERLQRWSLKLGNGLDPVKEALSLLFTRFTNLTTLSISYSGWMSRQGKQIDDRALSTVESCALLQELSLSYCCFITDVGIGNLTCCRSLQAVRLEFIPRLGGIGLLTLFSGCKDIKVVELKRCMNVYRLEWLGQLGENGRLEELCICNCRGIGEGDLMKLGRTWSVLKKLVYEVDEQNYRFGRVNLGPEVVLPEDVSCDALQVLKLKSCIPCSGRGLGSVLAKCSSLMELELDMCLSLADEDLTSMATKCSTLRSLLLKLPSRVLLPEQVVLTRPTDASLETVAAHCRSLEQATICVADGESGSSAPSFTGPGIVALVEACSSLRRLVLERVQLLDDLCLAAVCSSRSLRVLELVQCQEVTDLGLMASTGLKELRLCQCLGVTDKAFAPLLGTSALEIVRVEDCPWVSEAGLAGVAKSIYYRLDLSWMA